jgi:hypothetical protein
VIKTVALTRAEYADLLERQTGVRAGGIADLNFIKTFWRAEPSCLHLACVAECNPMTTHCGRAADLIDGLRTPVVREEDVR